MLKEDYFIQLIMIIIVIIMNMTSYLLYYLDKKRAIKNHSRIPERTLLFATFLFGGLGAWLGMKQFRHKTKRMKFKLLVPLAAITTVGALYFIVRSV